MYEELKQVLQRFNDGYVNRNVDAVDAFMDELFVHGPTTVILGTSNGELCLGREQAKMLIKGDWQYWSDLRVDPDQAIFHQVGGAYWFAVVASIKYEFETNDVTHERLVGFVKQQLEVTDKGALEALTTLSWGLAHYLSPVDSGKRAYLWPVRLTGVLQQDEGRWKFRYMQFCLPSAASPDQRLGTPALDHRHKGRTIDTAGFQQSIYHEELVDRLRQFISRLSAGDIDAAASQFGESGLNLVIDPQDGAIDPGDVVEKLDALCRKWGDLAPDHESTMTFSQGDLAWVVCFGVAHKSMDDQMVLNELITQIRDLTHSDLPAGEKLLKTQIGVVTALRDMASGSEYHWPFRLEVAFSRADGIWRIEVVHLSFPFYWIFEHKIPAQRV